MGQRRLERMTELIRQEISKQVPHLRDTGLGLITIVAVRMSHDFTQARVFYSVLGTHEEKQRTQVAIERAAPFFRSQLRHLENLKSIPELTFVLDTSAEDAQKVLDVLDDLDTERRQHPPES